MINITHIAAAYLREVLLQKLPDGGSLQHIDAHAGNVRHLLCPATSTDIVNQPITYSPWGQQTVNVMKYVYVISDTARQNTYVQTLPSIVEIVYILSHSCQAEPAPVSQKLCPLRLESKL